MMTPAVSANELDGEGVSADPDSTIACRLCEAPAAATFTLRLIEKHVVTFYRCSGCGSLQSEEPYWLDEAYANSNLARIDTGAAQRNLTNLSAVYTWARISGTRTIFDFGGGDGLLCRLLRDYGLDARMEDRYAVAGYAQGVPTERPRRPVLYTAFEVLEHFAHPQTDLEALFAARPESLLVTTAFYEGQGPDWWYLAPASGQHVFFYSKDAMRLIGKRFGYSVRFLGKYTLFDRVPRNAATKALTGSMLNIVGIRAIRTLLMLLPATGAARDFKRLTDEKSP
ncbi:class I SAM-dependent methyltransferase [Altericroceibacterium xinjiangense]|uniref:class I SAM-dependent methyltransferase n=1 Tax=Altericroceibacterium xinjiangense TaxID=762261 RepID=UPI000F7F69CA|nr:class I SAM-dependent methyltransferase [Altericroceibacterium xinjiangense]